MTRARWAAVARHNRIIVLNSWNFRLIPILKRANPKIQVWMYKDLSGIRSDDCRNFQGRCGHCPRGVADSRYLSSGMGYCWVKRHHPRWLLASSETGHPFQFRNYPSIWETDFGNRAYQRQWIHNVLTDVRDHGWSGVEVDNALTTADAYGISGKYPSNSAVQAATYSALRNIGHAMRDAGVASVFNVGYATSFPGLWQRWLRPVDGLEQEFYLGHPGQSAIGTSWHTYQAEISSCAALNKSCWFQPGKPSATGSSQSAEYTLASYLLAADGRQFLGAGNAVPQTARCWHLGAPTGSPHHIGAAWRRYFRWGCGARQPHRQVVDRVSRRVICRCPRRCHRGYSPAARQRRDSPDHPPGTCSRAPSRRPQNWALLMPAGCCCATPTSPASGFTLRTRPARRASESG